MSTSIWALHRSLPHGAHHPPRNGRTFRRTFGSAGNLEQITLFGPGAAGADDAPERARDPPLLADDLADVVRCDVEVEYDGVLTLLRLDSNGVRLVDEAKIKDWMVKGAQPTAPVSRLIRAAGISG